MGRDPFGMEEMGEDGYEGVLSVGCRGKCPPKGFNVEFSATWGEVEVESFPSG